VERRKLELDFLDVEGRRFRLSIDDPREDLESAEIEAAMEDIIDYNIFQSNYGDLISPNMARIVTTTVEEIKF